MQRRFSLPLFFFFVAACIGLMLRWHFVSPLHWLKFPYWLHAHSHTMFLGWIFNTLFLAYLSNYSLTNKRYNVLFISIQCLLGGMLISFPIQGYGAVSIILSTLHTISVAVFCWWIFSDLKKREPSISIWYTRISLILFLISSLGPFTLGPLMANGLGQTRWYYFAVYYYLHFQYNGVFIFGVFSLFYHLIEERGLQLNLFAARKSGWILLISIFPTYFLSTLWADPGLFFNAIGFAGSVLQLIALFYFIKVIQELNFVTVNPKTKILLIFAFGAFILKLVLQLISALPLIAHLAYDVRSFVISYLHLVVIGVVTLFLLAWYIEKRIVSGKISSSLYLILIGFVGSELIMVLSGTPLQVAFLFISSPVLLFLFSVLLTFGIGIFLLKTFKSSDKK